MAFDRETNVTDVESAIRLEYEGRAFTVRMDGWPGLGFWRVESDRRIYHSAVPIRGNETAAFFRALVQTAVEKHGA